MTSRTQIVLLMHPKEWKQEKAATGRLAHLCLSDSRILVGTDFDRHPDVQALLADPAYHPVLLYPGPEAHNLSTTPVSPSLLSGRRLLVFLLDATWACARKMLRLSPSLQGLPRVMFTPTAPSRYLIKQQPQDGCLSTIECCHELLLALEAIGLEHYPDKGQLLDVFDRMQRFQLACAADPRLSHHRRSAKIMVERTIGRCKATGRRRRYLKP